jgi:hypothetical protein
MALPSVVHECYVPALAYVVAGKMHKKHLLIGGDPDHAFMHSWMHIRGMFNDVKFRFIILSTYGHSPFQADP